MSKTEIYLHSNQPKALDDETSEENKILNLLRKQEQQGIQLSTGVGGVPYYDTLPEMFFNPSSLVKIITSALALDILGEDFRFKTKVTWLENSEEKSLSQLIFWGGGDPTWGLSAYDENSRIRLRQWVRQLLTTKH